MSNSLLTINMITREAVELFRNSNAFLMSIDRQYDDSFAKTGAKIGTALRIRLPNDYVVRTGAAASVQDTAEQNTTLTLATQKGVDMSFSSVERTMSLDDFSERVLSPAVNNLAGAVAYDIMSGVDAGGVANFVSNVDGSSNIISPVAATFLNAQALLDTNSAPVGRRKIVCDPYTMARTVSSLTGLFNPTAAISKQYTSGKMYDALGFEWMSDQTVLKHTTGAYSSPQVSSTAGQTGTTLAVAALSGPINAGDIINIAGVYAVNRVTKQSTGALRQFVVTATAATGATSLSIYPAIVPAAGGNAVQYQTVTASPAASANITVVSKASEVYRKNIAFVPEAITMATADLELPKGVHEAARENYDGISLRMVTAYNIATDQYITRLDILYGYLFIRPEWCVAVADAV